MFRMLLSPANGSLVHGVSLFCWGDSILGIVIAVGGVMFLGPVHQAEIFLSEVAVIRYTK